MSKFFKNLPLSLKLTLIGLIPLLFLLFLAIQVYKEKTEKITVLNGYLQRINQSVHIATLINQLQDERRYSFGYVLKHEGRTELVLQRPQTDVALKILQNDSDNRLINVASYTFLDSLSSTRSRIDFGHITPMEVMSYYTNTIFRLNTLNNVSAGSIVYLQTVNKDLVGQKLLSEMITYLGILRSQIYYDLYTQQNNADIITPLKSIYALFHTYETEFLLKASPETIRVFNQIRNQSKLKPTIDYITQAITTGKFTNTYDPEAWWDLSASGLDQLKNLQASLLNKVRNSVSTIYNKETKEKDETLFVLILMLVFVVFLLSFTIASISKSLKELKEGAQKIAAGATGLQFDIRSKDVIGELAQAILKLDESNKELANAAHEIGSGHFDVAIQARSKEDLLGNAIITMKKNLQQFTQENEEKIWVQTGIAKITESLQGIKDLNTLCTDTLHILIQLIGGSLGFFYVDKGNNLLEFISGYAVPGNTPFPKQVHYGETLIGQVALTKETLQLNDVPDDYVKINSSTGNTKAKHILIIPLLHYSQVEGVIELASLQPFAGPALTLLKETANTIAVAIQAAKSRMKLRELLEQTQNQADELQAQHEEMEHLNSELEAHTQRLQASEEELRVQQEELQQTNQELEERTRMLEERNQLIIERNQEIQRKAAELAQSNRYKSEFLANMSHELRTPLNSILLLSRLMAENNNKNLTSDQVEYANVIQSSGKGLLTLIDEILDLSKIEAGKMELEYSTVSIEAIANDMQRLFESVAREKQVQFETVIEENAPNPIETDKLRLEQILRNLIGNALKFTAKGSVTLTISGTTDNNTIRFSVKDTGIGIPKDKQQSIFEAFQQADGSTRRKYGGTGLGLSISRELTKLLGGTIQLTSEVNQGSTFTVSIPIKKSTEASKEIVSVATNTINTQKNNEEILTNQTTATDETPYTALEIPEAIPDDRKDIKEGDKIILIVEDDTAFARALLDFTRSKGYKGIVSVRGDEGILLAKQYKPMGILLDIQLPVKNGWEVMDDLKNDPQTRPIPVHIMSSYQVKNESLLKGAIDFINKPLAYEQMPEIFERIEQVLNRHPKKVLIVEENAKHAKALAYFLESNKVNAEIKSSIDAGVEALQKEDVDCVILDMGIPDPKAYDTLEAVKKNPGLENLPIIIFTGKSISKAEEQRIKQYADSIVVKTAHSYQRILDEVSLFLHLMDEQNENNAPAKRLRTLGGLSEVLNNKTVLIADDDVRNIFSLTKALERFKMNVVTAIDGKDALRQLEQHEDVDVILMDMMMPEMDGYQTIKTIRKNNRYKYLPIIAVTAKAMTGDREKCIQAGASDYITKPVDIDQLLSLLRVWLYDKM